MATKQNITQTVISVPDALAIPRYKYIGVKICVISQFVCFNSWTTPYAMERSRKIQKNADSRRRWLWLLLRPQDKMSQKSLAGKHKTSDINEGGSWAALPDGIE
jgi:hypothetical protein